MVEAEGRQVAVAAGGRAHRHVAAVVVEVPHRAAIILIIVVIITVRGIVVVSRGSRGNGRSMERGGGLPGAEA